jgi:phosphomannomutase
MEVKIMAKMLLIFSHRLTEEQVKEAKKNFNVTEFVYLPEDLQYIWSNVPPEGEFNERYLDGIKSFLISNSNENDYVLVQGEYGATYLMVKWCFENNLIPIYSTTKRVYEFTKNDDETIENKHIFKHVSFRLYKNNL